MGEPGGLPSMGLHRVGHDCSDLAAAAAEALNNKAAAADTDSVVDNEGDSRNNKNF